MIQVLGITKEPFACKRLFVHSLSSNFSTNNGGCLTLEDHSEIHPAEIRSATGERKIGLYLLKGEMDLDAQRQVCRPRCPGSTSVHQSLDQVRL